jgi:hypothetical protein
MRNASTLQCRVRESKLLPSKHDALMTDVSSLGSCLVVVDPLWRDGNLKCQILPPACRGGKAFEQRTHA